jgi:GTPase SAR1 family protein
MGSSIGNSLSTTGGIASQSSSTVFHLNAAQPIASQASKVSIVRRLSSAIMGVSGGLAGGSSSKALPVTRTLETLVIGCAGAGKTLLLKALHLSSGFRVTRKLNRLKKDSTRTNVNAITVPTVGVETMSCSLGATKLNFREVGSSMCTMWSSYYAQVSTVVFVIDASNFSRLAMSASELLSVFHELQNKKTCTRLFIVLNKMDLSSDDEVSRVIAFLRLGQLCRDYAGFFDVEDVEDVATVMRVSAVDGVGVDELLEELGKSEA